MSVEAKRRELLELILAVSFRRGKVTLASGKESDFYLDLRQTLMRPRGVALAGELVLEKLRHGPPVDAVGGMAVGAVPLVAAVLAAAARGTRRTRSWWASSCARRRRRTGSAAASRAASARARASRCVEDTVTTGGSTLDALAAVEAEGGKVARVLCLVDRGEGAAAAFAARGIALESLFTRADLPV